MTHIKTRLLIPEESDKVQEHIINKPTILEVIKNISDSLNKGSTTCFSTVFNSKEVIIAIIPIKPAVFGFVVFIDNMDEANAIVSGFLVIEADDNGRYIRVKTVDEFKEKDGNNQKDINEFNKIILNSKAKMLSHIVATAILYFANND